MKDKEIWQISRYERDPLAPYAMRAEDTKGRVHPETPHPLRTDFQRDKDRIVHSQSFRRMEYKTQVFVTGNCDHFRTRLTHTIEVAGITRTIVRSLGLNEDLAETIALAHDIGHPPFGHCGERALNKLLVKHGGFDHNMQALRVVDELEEKYPGYQGLNLSWEVRSGLLKHREESSTLDGETLPPQLSLEAQVADVADDLTYYAHDMDDGILAELVTLDDLKELQFWDLVERHWDKKRAIPQDDERFVPFMIRNAIDLMVADVTRNTLDTINREGIDHVGIVENRAEPVVRFSPKMESACAELKDFLFQTMYWSDEVLEDNNTAVEWMCQLFEYFLDHPEHVGRRSQRRIDEVGLHVAVGDYIAMMTDRYAIEQYNDFVRKT